MRYVTVILYALLATATSAQTPIGDQIIFLSQCIKNSTLSGSGPVSTRKRTWRVGDEAVCSAAQAAVKAYQQAEDAKVNVP